MGTREAINMHTCTTTNTCYENYDPCFPDQPVVDLYLPIWAHQPSHQSKPAFIWAPDGGPRSSITYSQLDTSIHSISSQLLIPLQRGDTVLILCSPGLDLVKILFSSQRAGLISVPISPPDLPPSKSTIQPHHLARVLLQTKPKAAIANLSYINSVHQYISGHSHLSQLFQDLKWLPVENFANTSTSSSSSSSTYLGCRSDEVYLIQYTSGATGIPKPVMVSAGSAAHNVRVARKAYDLQPNSIIVSWLPQYHDCGLMFLLLTVVSGATSILTSPSAFVSRPRYWVELITEFKATCTPVPSFSLPLVLRRGRIEVGHLPLNLGSLRNLVLINEPIYRESVEAFVNEFSAVGLCPSSISPSYGLAENCTYVSTAWSGTGSSFPNMPSYNKLLPSGRLAALPPEENEEGEMEIVVVDEETFELVEDGVEGEIWVSSPSNASGYLGHPSLTREVFEGRIRGKPSRSCFIRTGDRGVVRGEERYLFVTGRTSDVVKITSHGLELHPHQLETVAYNSCPNHLRGGCIAAFSIFNTTVVIIAELQRREGERGGGVVVYENICRRIEGAVRENLRIGIGVVVKLVESGSLPKTTSGKLQRWAAKEKLKSGELRVVFGGGGDDLGKGGGKREDFPPFFPSMDDHHRLSLISLL
ncbi:uncharacterized protein LOC131230446 [Magnolia sinica]|uniref:uncharacterized protein LOC131230446 n=1 Tax=Magnolia sinica TaxID=86752 RepID=UPI002657C4BC|nr:uncharacterized protein LOC131230446 [Magnolia sinica]